MTKIVVNLNELCEFPNIVELWGETDSVLDDLMADDCVPHGGGLGKKFIVFDFNDEQAVELRRAAAKLGIEDAMDERNSIQKVMEAIISTEMYALA
jgi:hypothetical protein